MAGLIATEGIHYMGTLNLRDGVIMKAFGKDDIIWAMSDEYHPDNWQEIWDEKLQKARASTPYGNEHYRKAQAYSVSMKNAAAPLDDGLLAPIVQKLEQGACSPLLFSSNLIRAVVGFKWHWTRKVVFAEFAMFLIWLISFLIHASMYNKDDLDRGSWQTPINEFKSECSAIASAVALAFMLPFTYISICEVAVNGVSHWLTFWNVFDVLAQVNQVICFLLYFTASHVSSDTYATLLGLQTVLLVLKIQYFSRAVLQVEVAFIDNLKELLPEAAAFLLFWLLTLTSFAIGLHCLFKKDLDLDENQEEIEMYYGSIWHSWLTLFGSMFKRFSYDPLLDSKRSIAVTLLFSIFLFLDTVILYNLIVSIVVSFNKKMKALSQMKLDTGRAIMVVELEAAIPKRFLQKLEKPYIHFLQLLPPEEIDPDKLWLNVECSTRNQESLNKAIIRRLHRAEKEIMAEIESLSRRIKESVNTHAIDEDYNL
eukprot:g675.t1